MQQTVSGELVLYLLSTLIISYILLLYTVKVKILLNYYNLQVTNVFNSLVGTSETICFLNKNKRLIHKSTNTDDYLKFRQWLAGLIDGDGCFTLSKKGYAGLEITMDIYRPPWASFLFSIKGYFLYYNLIIIWCFYSLLSPVLQRIFPPQGGGKRPTRGGVGTKDFY